MSNEASSSKLGRDPDAPPAQEEIAAKNQRIAALERQLTMLPAGSSAQVRASGTFSVKGSNDLSYLLQLASAASEEARKTHQRISEAVTTATQVSGIAAQLLVGSVRKKLGPKKSAKRAHVAQARSTTNATTYSDTGECPEIDPACQKSPEEQENERVEIEQKTRHREFEIARRCSDAPQAGNSISIPHEANRPQQPAPQEGRQERRVEFADDVLTQPIVLTQYEGPTEASASKFETNEQEENEARTKDTATQTDNQPVLLFPVKNDQETKASLRGYISEREAKKMNHACCFCGACIAITILGFFK